MPAHDKFQLLNHIRALAGTLFVLQNAAGTLEITALTVNDQQNIFRLNGVFILGNEISGHTHAVGCRTVADLIT